MSGEIRVQTYLSRLGVGSRRALDRAVEEGKVLINGHKAKPGDKVIPGKDKVTYRGRQLVKEATKSPKVYVLHKPRGLVTTLKDPEGRATVMDLIPWRDRKSMFPVGRLDLNSEGLLLLTNDGDLAHQLMHPSYEVPKVYEVKIRGRFDEKKKAKMQQGMLIGNDHYKPAEVLDVRDVTVEGTPKHIVKIKVFEGKNHHVRKLFENLGCRVIRLKRLQIANISLRGVPLGEFRLLSSSKVKTLKESLCKSA